MLSWSFRSTFTWLWWNENCVNAELWQPCARYSTLLDFRRRSRFCLQTHVTNALNSALSSHLAPLGHDCVSINTLDESNLVIIGFTTDVICLDLERKYLTNLSSIKHYNFNFTNAIAATCLTIMQSLTRCMHSQRLEESRASGQSSKKFTCPRLHRWETTKLLSSVRNRSVAWESLTMTETVTWCRS